MFCVKCGHKCKDGVKFCTSCGAPMKSAEPKPVVDFQPQTISPELHRNPEKVEQENPNQQVAQKAQLQKPSQQVNPSAGQNVQFQQANQQSYTQNAQYQNQYQQSNTQNAQYQNQYQQGNTQNVPQNKEKSKFSPKLLAMAGGALVIVVLLVLVVIKITGSKSGFETLSGNRLIHISLQKDSGRSALFVNKDGKTILDDESILHEQVQTDATGNIIGYIKDDDSLYVLSGKKEEKIASDVNKFKISADGTAISYITDYEDGTGTLYLRDLGKKEPKKVANNVVTYTDFLLSPDGNTIAFVQENDDTHRLCLSVNGKEFETIGKNKDPLAVSNGGKYLYFIDDGKLYVKTRDDQQKLSAEFYGSFLMNADCTEILFESDGKTYLSRKGKEKEKILSQTMDEILLPDTVTVYTTATAVSDYYSVYRLGVLSFTNQVYKIDKGYYYIDSKLETHKVCDRGISDIHISDSGDTVLYSDDGFLYKKTSFEKESQPVAINTYQHYVYDFVTDGDLSGIYYVDSDDVLNYMSLKGKVTKIAEDIDFDDLCMDPADSTLYFLADEYNGYGTLCYTKKGSKKTKVKNAEDVRMTQIGRQVFYYVQEDDYPYRMEVLSMMKNGKAYSIYKAED